MAAAATHTQPVMPCCGSSRRGGGGIVAAAEGQAGRVAVGAGRSSTGLLGGASCAMGEGWVLWVLGEASSHGLGAGTYAAGTAAGHGVQ